jgi:rfaE bifunctional protein nucleotidyltransferase chain/domain
LRTGNSLQQKILTLPELQRQAARWRLGGKTIGFTNGCFDILHAGHIASLTEAASYSDYLVVGLNTDRSVKALKGEERPINREGNRAELMASLAMVDAVVLFDEPTPLELILALRPEVLVKGGDYQIEQIAGAKEVIGWGGRVVINGIKEGFSTTGLIRKLRETGTED